LASRSAPSAWLLFERAESGAERAVFVLGALSLAGGAAAYLGVSPLGVGLIAGLTWTVAPGRADRIVQDGPAQGAASGGRTAARDGRGAGRATTAAVWLLPPYLLLSRLGKVIGAWLSARLADTTPADLAAYLMSPGVLAIALALNFRQMLPASSGDTLARGRWPSGRRPSSCSHSRSFPTGGARNACEPSHRAV
jgi:hypothetical protein